MLRRWLIVVAGILVLPATWPSVPWAQQAPAAAVEDQTFDPQQLDALLASIALYPDTLLTQLLMATTFPLQVVEAERWLQDPAHKDLKGDALVQALAAVKWDPSVKSLVPFPQVLAQLNGNLDWMQQVGYAFAAQQQDVFGSIQRLRRQAQSSGHLESTPQQVVRTEPAQAGQQTIIIQPAQADTVYVPSYNPTVVYGAWPYPSYPPVYVPPPPSYPVGTALASGLAFGAGVAVTAGLWGLASNNWNTGDVNVNVNRWNNINTNRQRIDSNVWRANARPGGLPPNLRRAPAGPVGRPARANGLPANAVGRQNVRVPNSLVDRPGRENRSALGQANRPNLAPGSRPQPPNNRRDLGQGNRAEIGSGNRPRGEAGPGNRATAGQGRRADMGAANRPSTRPAAANQPNIGQSDRSGIGQSNRAGANRAGGFQAGQAGARSGAFGGMSDGNRAAQFGQRGGQSRQFAAGGGGGSRQAGGGGFRGGGGSRGGGGGRR